MVSAMQMGTSIALSVVKVVLSKEQKEMLTVLSTRLGTSESETIRMALMDYVKELSLMSEALHKGNGNNPKNNN